jgi:hypothetical protein
VTRWFVQLEARFASVWHQPVEQAVVERLDRAGLLYDRDNGVQGDPGPILCATLVIEAADADAAAASGWEVYREALDAAGAEGYVHQRTVTVAMADVERRREEEHARMEAWMSEIEPGAEPRASDGVFLRDDLRRTEGG